MPKFVHDRSANVQANSRIALLLDALQTQPTPAACAVCLEQLDVYIASPLTEQTTSTRFAQVRSHLAVCAICVGAYLRLRKAVQAEMSGRLLEPVQAPTFDLRFLTSAAPAWADQVRTALKQIGNTLSLQLSGELLTGMTPVMAAPVRGARGEKLAELQPDEALRPLWPAIFSIYRMVDQPEQCLLQLQVAPPDRPFPHRKGIAVVLTTPTTRWETQTDAFGNATIAGIPVAHLSELSIAITL